MANARQTEILEMLKPLKTAAVITDSDSSPYTVALEDITGFTVVNTESSETVTFTITLDDGSSFSIPVLAQESYAGEFEDSIATIAYAGTTPSFTAQLLRR